MRVYTFLFSRILGNAKVTANENKKKEKYIYKTNKGERLSYTKKIVGKLNVGGDFCFLCIPSLFLLFRTSDFLCMDGFLRALDVEPSWLIF